MKKLVFIHSVPNIISRLNEEIKKRLEGAVIENLLDDQLSVLLKQNRDEVVNRLNTLIRLAEGSQKSEEVEIVLTCTALAAVAGEACRPLTILDRYLHEALVGYDSILLVATSAEAFTPTQNGIAKFSLSKDIRIGKVYVDGARDVGRKGDKELHDRLIKLAVTKALEEENYGAIVLCQPSMAHLRDELTMYSQADVLTGIDYFIENFQLQ